MRLEAPVNHFTHSVRLGHPMFSATSSRRQAKREAFARLQAILILPPGSSSEPG